jgi:acetyltransferase
MPNLHKLLNPQSVAVIGATSNQNKLGYGVSRNLISSGFSGEIYFVNPKGGVLFGHTMVTNLAHLPGQIDLAVIVIPAPKVARTMYACSQIGIKNFIIISGGFSEIGKTGANYEAECIRIAEEENLHLIGPNCIGVIDTHFPIDTTFIQPPMPEPGDIGFITHSGALGAGVIDWVRGAGFSFSRILSLGNQIQINESDVIGSLVADPHTAVITLYLESVKDGKNFITQTTKASQQKPVIALKVGRSEKGKQAASSHTGALAGSDNAFDAAFLRSGVIRATTTEELFNWAKALAWSPMPSGNRVAVLTNAGGPGVAATDALALNGLFMAEISGSTRSKLEALLPVAASVENPIDILASASAHLYADCLKILLEAPEVDMVMVIAPPPPMYSAEDIVTACLPIIDAVEDKPVVFSLMGSKQVSDGIDLLRRKKIPEYNFPEKAAASMGALWKRAKIVRSFGDGKNIKPEIDKSPVGKLLESLTPGIDGLVPQQITEEILDIYGVSIGKQYLANSEKQAGEIAKKIGFPVVLKIAAAGISHKSELGGIVLNLQDENEVQEAFQQLTSSVRDQEPELEVLGAYLQKMVLAGQEVIVGAVRDPIFGPMVMFGSGGVEVEGIKDINFALAPLTSSDLDYLIDNSWAGTKLNGFRHFQPGDINALKEVLVRIGQLIVDYQQIEEVEINPLYVFDQGQGVTAVDVRMYLSSGKAKTND